MKANRKFVEGEEAVSAVIGVILMVAITVAIAAAVYVYVSGMITGTTQSTPTISCVVDNNANTLMVSSAESGINWSDIKIKTDQSEVWIKFRGEENSTAIGNSFVEVTQRWTFGGSNYTVSGGDTFQIIGPSSLSGDVKITLLYEPTNALLGTWTITV